MDRVAVPVGVVALVATNIADVPLVGLGLKVALAPAGSPPALSVTLPVNPPLVVRLRVEPAPLPCVTVWLDGLAESEKSGACCTTRVTLVVWLRLPLTPVMVRV